MLQKQCILVDFPRWSYHYQVMRVLFAFNQYLIISTHFDIQRSAPGVRADRYSSVAEIYTSLRGDVWSPSVSPKGLQPLCGELGLSTGTASKYWQ